MVATKDILDTLPVGESKPQVYFWNNISCTAADAYRILPTASVKTQNTSNAHAKKIEEEVYTNEETGKDFFQLWRVAEAKTDIHIYTRDLRVISICG